MKTIGIIKYAFTLVGIGALAVALWLYSVNRLHQVTPLTLDETIT